MTLVPPKATTLPGLLRERAETHPDLMLLSFLDQKGAIDEEITCAGLYEEAQALAAHIVDAAPKAERVLLWFPAGLTFVKAFFAVLAAGKVPVPAYPPRAAKLEDDAPHLAVAEDAQVGLIVADEKLAAKLRSSSLAQALPGVPLLGVTEAMLTGAPLSPRALPQAGDIAFLQYTSGSTSHPKGVMVSHANILANERMIADRYSSWTRADGTSGVGWLPPYHDMGLIGCLLHSVYLPGHYYLMSPTSFLRRPFRWLQAISTFSARATGAPTFAYQMCVDRISDKERDQLDLSSLEIAFVGAERVRATALEAFAEKFAPAGFSPEAFIPSYGLAETTLVVSSARPGAMRTTQQKAVAEGVTVSAGTALDGCEVAVVDDDGQPAASGAVGEIWVKGPHVTAGYFQKPALTAAHFDQPLEGRGTGFFRTGDLGLMVDDELFVVGRKKDVVVVRGKNIAAEDIEATCERSPSVTPAGLAAFCSVQEDREQLVVLFEAKLDEAAAQSLFDEVTAALAEHKGIAPDVLAIVPRVALPRTSSGKVKRHRARELYQQGELKISHQRTASAPAPRQDKKEASPVQVWLEQNLGFPAAHTGSGVRLCTLGFDEAARELFAADFGVDLSAIDLDQGLVADLSVAPAARSVGPVVKTAAGGPTGDRTPAHEVADLERFMVDWVCARLQREPHEIDRHAVFTSFGLDSVAAVQFVAALEERLGRAVDVTDAWEHPTIASLAAYLAPVPGTARPLSAPSGIIELARDEAPDARAGTLLLDGVFFVAFFGLTGLAAAGASVPWLWAAARFGPVVAAASLPVAFVLFLTLLILASSTVALLLPKPEAGLHALRGSKAATAWGLRFVLQRILYLPLWRRFIFGSNILRYLTLRGLGAGVSLHMRTATDAWVLDPVMLKAQPGVMLSAGTSVAGHIMGGNKLLLGEVVLDEHVLLLPNVTVAPDVRIGKKAVVGYASAIFPHVRIGAGVEIKNHVTVHPGAHIGDAAVVGAHCVIGAGAQIAPGTRVPDGVQVPAGAHVDDRTVW